MYIGGFKITGVTRSTTDQQQLKQFSPFAGQLTPRRFPAPVSSFWSTCGGQAAAFCALLPVSSRAANSKVGHSLAQGGAVILPECSVCTAGLLPDCRLLLKAGGNLASFCWRCMQHRPNANTAGQNAHIPSQPPSFPASPSSIPTATEPLLPHTVEENFGVRSTLDSE